jgi:hypothetical protein
MVKTNSFKRNNRDRNALLIVLLFLVTSVSGYAQNRDAYERK